MENQTISTKFLRIAIHNKALKDIFIKFADILAKFLGFSYVLLTPPDEEFGRDSGNGSWTGIIGMIQRGEADLSVSGTVISLQRAKVVKFSYPFHLTRFTFATKKAEYRSELTAFIKPFSLQVWLLIIACIVTMPLALTLLFKKKVSFKNLIWIMYKSFVGQAIGIKPKRIGDYGMMMGWIVTTTILCYSYNAVLLSFLTFPSVEQIRTIPELANAVARGVYQCATLSGSFLVNALAESSDVNMKIIGQSLQGTVGYNDVFAAFNDTKSERNLAFVAGDLNPFQGKYFVSDDEFVLAYAAIPMQQTFSYKEQLDRLIGRIWASGLFEKLTADESFMVFLKNVFHMPENHEKHRERKLSFEDLTGAFIMLALGYLLSTIIFVFEILTFKMKV